MLQFFQRENMHLFDVEIKKMINSIFKRNVSFVIKLFLAMLNQEIFIFRAKIDEQIVVHVLKKKLKIMLQQLNFENIHMRLNNYIIQNFIFDEFVFISLFIINKDRSIFTFCCKQINDFTSN